MALPIQRRLGAVTHTDMAEDLKKFLQEQAEAAGIAKAIIRDETAPYGLRFDAVQLELRRCEMAATPTTPEEVVKGARVFESYLKGD